jgi:hypothetical protein
VGSLSDITFIAERNTTPEEINDIFKEEILTDRYKEVLSATDDPIVSTDIIQSTYAAIVDLEMTRVVDGDLVKIMAWYDNEWGFSNQMIRQIKEYNMIFFPSGDISSGYSTKIYAKALMRFDDNVQPYIVNCRIKLEFSILLPLLNNKRLPFANCLIKSLRFTHIRNIIYRLFEISISQLNTIAL